MNPQLILLGAPGSGKGTQAARLVSELGFNHISTGDLLRNEIASGSELGEKVKGIMQRGELVDDETVLELLKSNCDLSGKAYIFDGFPRNIDQAKALDKAVLGNHKSVAIYFDIDLGELKDRIVNRRTCSNCGEIFNLLSKAPQTPGVCDACGERKLTQRKDDNEETVTTRLNVFKEAIDPILSHYESEGRLKKIEAGKPSVEVFEQLKMAVKE